MKKRLSRRQVRLLVIKESNIKQIEKVHLYQRILNERNLKNKRRLISSSKTPSVKQLNEGFLATLIELLKDLNIIGSQTAKSAGRQAAEASTEALKQTVAGGILTKIAPGFAPTFLGYWAKNVAQQLTPEKLVVLADGKDKCKVLAEILFSGFKEAFNERYILETIFGKGFSSSGGPLKNAIARIVQEALNNTLLDNRDMFNNIQEMIEKAVCMINLDPIIDSVKDRVESAVTTVGDVGSLVGDLSSDSEQ